MCVCVCVCVCVNWSPNWNVSCHLRVLIRKDCTHIVYFMTTSYLRSLNRHARHRIYDWKRLHIWWTNFDWYEGDEQIVSTENIPKLLRFHWIFKSGRICIEVVPRKGAPESTHLRLKGFSLKQFAECGLASYRRTFSFVLNVIVVYFLKFS